MTTSRLSHTVMRRVHFIHAVRPLASGIALGSAILLLALWGIGREVWVAHVIENMPALTDLAAVGRFFIAAFLNTRFVVQVLSLGAVAALIYTFVDFVRAVGASRRLA